MAKKIGVLSDTHSHLDEKVFTYFEDCDEIWHGGDIGTLKLADELAAFKPLRACYGNIDGQEIRAAHPLNNRFEIEGLKVLITHICGKPGRYNARVKKCTTKNLNIYISIPEQWVRSAIIKCGR